MLVCCVTMLMNMVSINAAEVEAEGRAAGDQRGAREQALADALREAVRKGTGVDILSTTGVSDFVLEYDRILSAAFGYVQKYQIISSGLGADQIYRVKVRAQVEKGTPGAKNILALRQLIMSKGSPRVSIAIEEEIDGVSGNTRYAQGVMEQVARELQMNLVDIRTAKAGEQKRAARDEILGDKTDAKIRKADITQKSDFLIEGKVVARYVGQQSFFGSLPQHVFSVGGELRALRPETGEVVAAVALPGTEKIESELESKEMAARDVIQKVLNKGRRQGELPPLMSMIFARWVTECDLGALKRLEFSKINNENFRGIADYLKGNGKIGAVWVREFDSRGISSIDVETRLESAALGAEVLRGSNESVSLDRYTKNLLSYVTGNQGEAQVISKPESPESNGDNHSAGDPVSDKPEASSTANDNILWVTLGAVVLVLIIAVAVICVLLIKKK